MKYPGQMAQVMDDEVKDTAEIRVFSTDCLKVEMQSIVQNRGDWMTASSQSDD